MSLYTIYLIRNTRNGMVYIGQTRRCLSVRWFEHRKRAWIFPETRLHRAMALDVNAFRIERLEVCQAEEANHREYLAMSKHRSLEVEFGYNLNPPFGYTKCCGPRNIFIPVIGPTIGPRLERRRKTLGEWASMPRPSHLF